MYSKKTIIKLPYCYTVNKFNMGAQTYIAAGSEQNHPTYLINLENNFVTKISEGPGGMMGILPVPNHNDLLVSVMGLFPPFIGLEAGVYLHKNKNEDWKTQKVISLPFAHRCEILTFNKENHLFISTVSRHKENPEDWSNPGELHHVNINSTDSENWSTEVILDDLFQNHGMTKSVIKKVEVICISGDKGIFAIKPGCNNKWEITNLFDHPVSEFSFFDLDNDGEDELVTIEPFHGNTLNIYKKNKIGWQLIYNSPLSFGHGLCTGKFQNNNVVVVGNRRESEALELHKIHSIYNIEKITVENNVGPTQTKIFNYKGVDYILSSNQVKNEVVLYY